MSYSESFAATCKIESGPPAELANYIRDTKRAAQDIANRYSANICASSQTPITSLNRSLSTYDKATDQLPIMNNIITDFTFNIVTLYRIEMPPVVITHGQLLYSLEKNSLLPVLDGLASRCQLDGPGEWEIVALIKRNNDIQNYFKWVAIGTIWASSDNLESAILSHYEPSVVAECKNKLDFSTIAEKIAKAGEWYGKDLTEARENWDAAMAMIDGKSSDPKKSYAILQKELLQKELRRQWLSQWAMQQIMTNLECMQKEASWIDSIADWSRARAKCVSNPIIGYEKLVSAYQDLKTMTNRLVAGVKSFFWEWDTPAIREQNIIPKDTDQYMRLSEKIDKAIRVESNILIVYGDAVVNAGDILNEEATTNTIITNLANIHTTLVGMNWLLEKRIPKMRENCMKWNPGILGWCYAR